jgi:hypothetical protein
MKYTTRVWIREQENTLKIVFPFSFWQIWPQSVCAKARQPTNVLYYFLYFISFLFDIHNFSLGVLSYTPRSHRAEYEKYKKQQKMKMGEKPK